MKCPVCEGGTKILSSRPNEKNVFSKLRRHECKECFTRFNTSETIITSSLDPHIVNKIIDGGFNSELSRLI